jgi:predicted Zn-dependent protease
MIRPQEIISQITAAADYADCIVVVSEETSANLRWANNTLTTNGVIANRSVTVIAFVELDGGMAAGAITRTDVSADEAASVAALAKQAALDAGKAEDAFKLVKDFSDGDWEAAHIPRKMALSYLVTRSTLMKQVGLGPRVEFELDMTNQLVELR